MDIEPVEHENYLPAPTSSGWDICYVFPCAKNLEEDEGTNGNGPATKRTRSPSKRGWNIHEYSCERFQRELLGLRADSTHCELPPASDGVSMSPRPRLRSRSRAGSRVVREIRFKPHQVFKTVQCFTDDDGRTKKDVNSPAKRYS